MQLNYKIKLAAILLGIAVFTGLGFISEGSNSIAAIFLNIGIGNQVSIILSKFVLGMTASASILLFIIGYSELMDGVEVNRFRLKK